MGWIIWLVLALACGYAGYLMHVQQHYKTAFWLETLAATFVVFTVTDLLVEIVYRLTP